MPSLSSFGTDAVANSYLEVMGFLYIPNKIKRAKENVGKPLNFTARRFPLCNMIIIVTTYCPGVYGENIRFSICMCINTCPHIYMIHTYLHTYVCIWTCTYTCKYTHTCAHRQKWGYTLFLLRKFCHLSVPLSPQLW